MSTNLVSTVGATGPGPAHDKGMAARFLAALDPNATRFTFQFFSDGPKKHAAILNGTLDEVWPKVQEHNTPESQIGVFVTINETDLSGRRTENIVRPRALFVDADGDEQAMHCLGAIKACGATPSMIVKTRRGIHVYWICSDIPLDQFSALQERLIKMLGTDAAIKDLPRVMRLPGTLHLKNPADPRLVKLAANTPFQRWQSSELVAKLGLSPSAPALKSNVVPLAVPAALQAIPYYGSLGAGLELHHDRPLDPAEVIRNCPHFTDADTTHGAGYPQGLWMMDVLAATFFKDGKKWAHHFSKGYVNYSAEETDKMWDRKMAERESRSLGWPSCGAIEAVGCKQCATCPLKGKIKSPLRLALSFTQSVKNDGATPANIGANGLAAVNRSQVARPTFRDFTQAGQAKSSLANAVIAIRALGINARYDLFHHRIQVIYKGEARTIREGLLTDDIVSAIRSLINNTYQIDCGDPNTLAGVKEIAQESAFDPVLDMLVVCQGKWDGRKRLDTWVVDYLGCEDTPLNRAIGQKVLIAGVRRARLPGCKFDTITVLEGVEGTNKSTAIRVLAGDENFSDQSIIGANDKEVQEQLEGVWMHENADLAGMRRADVEHVKAFASRQVDRARPAYGRVREDRPRRSIEWGTTNNDEYLQSQAGNRRFWPLKTGKIDIEALNRDRDQLLGEAARREAAGESITLDPSIWGDARDAQEQRRVPDPWEDLVAKIPEHNLHRAGDGYERVASADVLEHVLNVPRKEQTSAQAQRLANAMKRVGWGRNPSGKVNINGAPVRGYVRPAYGPTGPIGMTAENAAAGPLETLQ